jgi:hypothetical protein
VASDLLLLHRPSMCGRRPFLVAHETRQIPSAYRRALSRLREELQQSYPELFDEALQREEPSPPQAEAEELIRRHLRGRKGRKVIRLLLHGEIELDGTTVPVYGRPPLLMPESPDGWVVQTGEGGFRGVTNGGPKWLVRRLQLYGWLFEQTFGQPPTSLRAPQGFETVDLPYDGAGEALEDLATVWRSYGAASEPYSPVGTTKCRQCVFRAYCVPAAEATDDISLVARGESSAFALSEAGYRTMHDLEGLDEAALAAVRVVRSGKARPVGRQKARDILQAVEMRRAGGILWKGTPEIPEHPNYAMLDVEDHRGMVFLWGLQVFGEQPSEYLGLLSNWFRRFRRWMPSESEVWFYFLGAAKALLGQYGDLPFVHYGTHERTILRKAIASPWRTTDDTPERVEMNLLDLEPIVKQCVRLPSYGLKEVERYAGFVRQRPDIDAQWIRAMFRTDVELGNRSRERYLSPEEEETAREHLSAQFEQVEAYNREDLEGMWAVVDWLRSHR